MGLFDRIPPLVTAILGSIVIIIAGLITILLMIPAWLEDPPDGPGSLLLAGALVAVVLVGAGAFFLANRKG